MKRKILSLLLAGSILISYSFNTAAASIIVEEASGISNEEKAPDIITEEQVSDIIVEESPSNSGLNKPHAIAPYGAESYNESVGTAPLYDSNILWNKPKNDSYWSTINWSEVQWNSLSGYDDPASLITGWADKVDWAQVNWKSIDWSTAYESQNDPNWSAWSKWSDIPWNQVNWNNMAWENVDWKAIADLSNQNKLTFTLAYNGLDGNNQILTPVIDDTNLGPTIISSRIVINLYGVTVPKESYIITVQQSSDVYKLHGLHNSTNAWGDSTSFFDNMNGLPDILNKSMKYPLTQDDYWVITIDDDACTFAADFEPLPDITITSKDGKITLQKDIDYTVKPTKSITSCGEHEITIAGVPSSNFVDGGSVNKSFTVHYADIQDFYTLKGIPTEITVKDNIPNLTEDLNSNGCTKENLAYSMYLEPKDNDMLKNGRLPSVNNNTYGSELFNSDGFLKIEYRYDHTTAGEPVWLDTFDWNTWLTNHTSDILHVRVSVNETVENRYPKPGTGPVIHRYIKGSIYTSVRIKSYSLEEIYPEKEPKTAPTSDGYRTCYIAAVNPKPKNFNTIPTNAFESIGENPIDSVTYNGMKQTPTFICSVYKYSPIEEIIGGYPTDSTKYGYWEYNQNDGQFGTTITYENNINAGTGIVRISFDGVFAGSITREFKIQEKDIADTSVSVQAQDFLYDGKPHAPILSISDSQANTVLREGIDYTVTSSGNITSPGIVTATITGIGNYTSTRTVQYKIVSTSVIVPGTKLEQIADIPEKIADQKYTGQPVTPEVAITGKSSGMNLVKDKDYKVSYLNNIGPGTAYAVVEGIGNYGGTYIVPFKISGADISNATVTVNGTYTYTGKAIIPSVTVKMGDKVIDPADYEVTATDNINAGTGKFTVTGRNNCTGITGESTFKIKKANQKLSITKAQAKALLIRNTNANTYKVKVTGAKTKLSYKVSNKKIATVDASGKLSFKHICGKAFVSAAAPASTNYNAASLKISFAVKPATPKIKVTPLTRGFKIKATSTRDITGYQVGYSTSSSFAASKTVKKRFDTTKALDKSLTGLSAKKIYYVRVRAYKIASNGTRYWGNWTKGQKITTK